MYQVIHLIPVDGIGGVERAAASMQGGSDHGLRFTVRTVVPARAAGHMLARWNPWWYVRCVCEMLVEQPDVLVVSLWRAYAVGVLVSLLRPRTRLVTLLHFPEHVHVFDRFFTPLAARRSIAIWADSGATLTGRLPCDLRSRSAVIPFVTERIQPLAAVLLRPSFVYWGRLHRQKGLGRALRIFAAVRRLRADATFTIVGPDGGERAALEQLVAQMALGESVRLLGPLDFAGIRREAADAAFYLQTSEREGMGMSVVEAMQLGLVPVVTPVGEIASYARHLENAVVISDDDSAVADVVALLAEPARLESLRSSAIATWANAPLYRDAMGMALCSLLSAPSASPEASSR